jgi:hypothetical protein
MTGLRPLVCFFVGTSRWLLPWIAILLVSAAAAYGLSAALARSSSTQYGWASVTSTPTAREAAAFDDRANEHAMPSFREARCYSLFGSYNFWLYDKDQRGPCGLGSPEC